MSDPVDATTGGQLLFLGGSTQLLAMERRARQQGFTVAGRVSEHLLCVVADEDVLDGMCTPDQGEALARCRAAGIECLTPAMAGERLDGAVRRQEPPPEPMAGTEVAATV